jgi:UDP-N-acetyl-D-galactosamine dehydrogenase
MTLYEKILQKKTNIAVVGLGYVGLPLAVSFSKKVNVIGFDINSKKINGYINGKDATNEVGDEELKKCKVKFTSDDKELKNAHFIIVAVPTPISANKTPDLSPVIGATEIVAKNLQKDSIVVYESTVYPGVTEDICVPILEKISDLKCGKDFKIGYSPERINPGDKVHRLENIVKIVSGIDDEALDIIAKVYELIIEVGVYRAESIKVAEAAKVVENSQRDINISFMNELAMVFDKMNIDTKQVINAMNTKWNALKFTPGLVGGHCIGVDPYYFIYEAERLGYHSQIILAGRKINDDMGRFVAESTIKKMIKADKKIKNSNVAVLGITFKENCPDVRNTKVIDIINHLKNYDVNVLVSDPIADKEEVSQEYGIDLVDFGSIKNIDCVIVTVAHDEYKKIDWLNMNHIFNEGQKVLIDVKFIYDRKRLEENGFIYWSL